MFRKMVSMMGQQKYDTKRLQVNQRILISLPSHRKYQKYKKSEMTPWGAISQCKHRTVNRTLTPGS